MVPKNSCSGPHSLNINGQAFEKEADIANVFNEILTFPVGVGAFVIGLSQISSFFSSQNLAKRLTLDEADASPTLEKLSNYIENKISITQ